MNPNQLAMPRARKTDPETSVAAAASVRNISETHKRILGLYQVGGAMSDPALCIYFFDYYGHICSDSGIRTRRKELVERGLVKDTGRRVRLPSGRQAVVWGLA